MKLTTIISAFVLYITLAPSIGVAQMSPVEFNKDVFIENKGQLLNENGQTAHDIKFYSSSNGVNIFFRSNGVSFAYNKVEKDANKLLAFRLDLDFLEINPDVVISSTSEVEGSLNYYLAQVGEPITNVQRCEKLIYNEVYPGIDLEFYFSSGGLKYDFIVEPGADPKLIKLQYSEALVKRENEIEVLNDLGTLKESKLKALQNGREIACDYIISEDNIIQYNVGHYSVNAPLVIDPLVVLWSTYYGGTGGDGPQYSGTVDVNSSGEPHITGVTNSPTSISTPGAVQTNYVAGGDIYVAKFSSSGNTLLWGTYYGGANFDAGNGIEIGSDDYVYVVATTGSSGLATPGSYDVTLNSADALITKFSPTGALVWSTYYGGPSGDDGRDIEIDLGDNIYVCGVTNSPTDIATPGAYQTALGSSEDGYIVKFNSSGNRLWGTYFGGTSGSGGIGDDEMTALAVDQVNEYIYGTGITLSPNNLASPGAHQDTYAFGPGDSYLVKFDLSGNYYWSTYYGANDRDHGRGLAVDDEGSIYMTGWTYSPSGPTTAIASPGSHQDTYGGGINDSFLAKFLPDGTRDWGTYYGGSDGENGTDVVTHDCHVYIGGHTLSGNNIATPDGFIPTHAFPGMQWGFFAKFNKYGVRKWGTYLGTANAHSAGVEGLAFYAPTENMYVYGWDTDGLLATPGAYQTVVNGGGDVLLVNFEDPTADIIDLGPDITICPGGGIILDAGFFPGASYAWNYNSSPTGVFSQSIGAISGGTYCVEVTTVDGCAMHDCINVTIPDYILGLITTTPLCDGQTVCLDVNIGIISGPAPNSPVFSWDFGDGLPVGTLTPSICHTFSSPGSHTIVVTMTTANGCSYSTSLTITLNGAPPVTILGPSTVCSGESVNLFALSPAGSTYLWSSSPLDPSLLGQENNSSVNVSPAVNTTYTVTITDINGCTSSDDHIVNVQLLPFVALTTTTGLTTFCSSQKFAIIATNIPGATYTWTTPTGVVVNTGNVSSLAAVYGGGTYCVEVTDASGCVNTACITLTYINAGVTFAIPINTSFCPGSTICLYPQIILNSGPPPTGIVLSWDYGDGSPATSSSCHTYNAPGVYEVTVTMSTAEGCIYTYSSTVTIHSPPAVGLALSPNFICPGGSLTLIPFVSIGVVDYLWNTGQTSSSIAVTQGGVYAVTVTDGNGCQASSSTVITGPMSLTYASNPPCDGNSFGEIAVSISGGTAPYTYAWADDPSETSGFRDGLSEGVYTVTVTDANGCVLSENILLEDAEMTFDIILNNLCSGDACNPHHIIELVDVVNGQGPYTFYSNYGVVTGDELYIDYSEVDENGATITIEVEDVTGCISAQTITVPGLYSLDGIPSISPGGFVYSGGSWCIDIDNAIGYELVIYDNSYECVPEPIYESDDEFDIDDPCEEHNLYVCFNEGNVGYDACYGVIGSYELTLYDCEGNDWLFEGDINGSQVGECDCCCSEGSGMGQWCDDCFFGFICTPNGTPAAFVHQDEVISTQTNWINSTHYVEGTLVVSSGETLNIQNSEVIFSEGARLIVEVGAKLNTNQSTLHACDFVKWKGIEVRGNPFSPQTPAFQGRVDIKNSVIRDADIGICAGYIDSVGNISSSQAGGIVRVRQDSEMKNNGTHIYIAAFDNQFTQTIISNSFFDQTDLLDRLDGSLGHIVIEDGKGYLIDNNVFTAGKRGITILKGSDFSINDNDFSKLTSSLLLRNASSLTIFNNSFTIGDVGISLDNCKDFKIEGNSFNKINYPIRTNDSKEGLLSTIKENLFLETKKAISFKNDDHMKLEIDCNMFDQFTEHAIYSYNCSLNDIGRSDQGAGNQFNSASNANFDHVMHTGNNPTYYFSPNEAGYYANANGIMSIPINAGQLDAACSGKSMGSTIKKRLQINVSPNPSSGTFQVSVQGSIDNPITFELLDIAGRSVYTRTNVSQEIECTLDVRHLRSGMYTLQVTSGSECVREPLLLSIQ